MAQRRQADAGLNAGRRVALTRLGTLATAAGLAGCAGSRQPVVPERSVNGGPFVLPMAAPAPRPGERWVYREINNYNGGSLGNLEWEVLSLAPLTLSQRRTKPTPAATSVAMPRNAVELRFETPWSALVEASFDDEYHFVPAVPLLPPRLEPGSSSWTRHRFTVPANSGNYGWQQRVTATGAEIIEAPIGRFDTLVIRREIWFDSPRPFRYNCDRTETRWYAPAVNGFVRRTWTGSYLEEGSIDLRERRREDWVTQELIEYRPGHN